ncbi:MAG: hypothetical protein WCS42_24215 [Verrucomicrobiota bacterium]
MMLHVYQLITLLMAVLVAIVTLRERNLGRQITGGVVLVMLILRIFLIK